MTAEGWYRADGGPLGFAETAVKAAAFLVAYAAFVRSLGRPFTLPSRATAAEVMLLGLAELGLLAAIWDRVIEREVTACVFVLANTTAHLGLLWALCTHAVRT